MTTEKLTHPVVKAAIEALAQHNLKNWQALFTADVELYDDGSPRDFKHFTIDAIGHEWFTSIDKVDENGLAVFGHFHSDTWGDFKTFFRFQITAEGKISRLDIGQA